MEENVERIGDKEDDDEDDEDEDDEDRENIVKGRRTKLVYPETLVQKSEIKNKEVLPSYRFFFGFSPRGENFYILNFKKSCAPSQGIHSPVLFLKFKI